MKNSTAKIKKSNARAYVAVTAKFENGATFCFKMTMSRNKLEYVVGGFGDEAENAIATFGRPFMNAMMKKLDNTSPVALADQLEAAFTGCKNFTEIFAACSKL